MKRVVAAVLLLVVSCAPGSERGRSGDRMVVVATVSPITNLVENVGGGLIDLTGLVPEGVNSHTFEPRPSDAKLLAEATLIFMNGLHLEEPTVKLAESNLRRGAKIIKLADRSITEDEWIFDFSFPESGGDPNPHLWTNPIYALEFVEIIAEELSKADPRNASAYRKNETALKSKIEAIDEAVESGTETVAVQNRKLVTFHDSFPYFARKYGWEIIGAIQPSDFSEPTPREVAALIDQIRNEGVPAIFGSEVFASPVLEQIARESGARYIADLRDDDLPGDTGDPEHSYLGLMRFDFVTIISALGGEATALDSLDVTNMAATDAIYR